VCRSRPQVHLATEKRVRRERERERERGGEEGREQDSLKWWELGGVLCAQ